MKFLKRILLSLIVLMLVLGSALFFWYRTLGKDNGPDGRPTYGAYTWANGEPPRGGPKPRSDGFVVGSQGNAFILPPMPPERPMDIHRADTVAKNNSIKSCF